MTKMPKRFYIFVLVLLLYFWPWQLFSGDLPADWLLSVITMQLVFVIICNAVSNEKWATYVIIIEVVCMSFNIAYVLLPSVTYPIHSVVTLSALIMELLIITGNGVINGSDHSRHIHDARDNTRLDCSGINNIASREEGVQ